MTNPKITSLQDRFTGSSVDTSLWTSGGSISGVVPYTLGEELVFPTTTSPGNCGVSSAGLFDLTSSEFTVEVVTPGDLTQSMSLVVAVSQGGTDGNMSGDFALFKMGDAMVSGGPGMYSSYFTGSEIRTNTAAYNNALYRFLRLREAGGTLYWDTSEDGVVWSNFANIANPIPVTAVCAAIYVINPYTRTVATSAAVANVGFVPASSQLLSPGMGDN